MGKRLDYRRARRPQRTPTDRRQQQLERAADAFLAKAAHANRPRRPERRTPPPAGSGYYRARGAVLCHDGIWSALGENDNIIGNFATRAEAWAEADKLGMVRVELKAIFGDAQASLL